MFLCAFVCIGSYSKHYCMMDNVTWWRREESNKRVHCSTLVKGSRKLFIITSTAAKAQTQDAHTSRERETRQAIAIKTFWPSPHSWPLSSLCMLHGESCRLHLPAKAAGGVHAVLANQDYSAEQRLDMAVSNPL